MKVTFLLRVAIPCIIFFSVYFACCKNPYTHGKILYENFCEQCHFENGEGLKNLIPPLAGADYLEREKANLACIIRYGVKGEMVVNGITYDQVMTASPQLTDSEITNVINYINSAWGNDYGYVKITEVQEALEKCDKTYIVE